MAEEPTWRLLLPRQLRELPADLAAVVVLAIITLAATTLPVLRETPLRIALGFPFVLFLPGYALIAALFPEAGEGPGGDGADGDGAAGAVAGGDGPGGDGAGGGGSDGAERSDEDGEDGAGIGRFSPGSGRGIDGIERVALSFGLSIAVVPLIALVLNFTPWGIRFGPILVSVGGFTLVATAVAARRRWELPPDDRFRVPYRRWVAAGREELFEPETRTDAALNVVLVASIVLAAASVGFAIAVPQQGETFTEFYYLTETEDGELVADDYPTEFTVGEARPLIVGIGNQEHEPTNYTAVIELQNVTFGGPNGTTATVHDQAELARYSVALDHNETSHRPVQLRPTMTGERLRVQLLLYNESAPADASVATAYRDTHLWVNVSAAGG